MITASVNPKDRRYMFMVGDLGELKRLEKHLNQIPKHMFLPSFTGIPKPEIFLRKFNKDGRQVFWCHSGLWHEVYTWCRSEGIAMQGVHDDKVFKYTSFDWSKEKFSDWVDSLGLSLEMRPYQKEAAWLILKYRQSMSKLATRSGKTLIAYVVFRWLMEFAGAHNILMIVPSRSLVRQGYEDMKDYKEFFKTETIWAKSELVQGSNLTIGTMASLVNRVNRRSKHYNPKFFEKFDVVLCDECHKAKCKSIDTILTQPFMQHVKLKFGFSGTIPDSGIESLACQSLMGPVIQDISTKELIDAGYLADVEVEQIYIHYPEDRELHNSYIRYGEYLCSTYVADKEKDTDKKLLPKEDRHFLVQHEKALPFAVKEAKKTLEAEKALAMSIPSVEQRKAKMDAAERKYEDYLIDLCKGRGSNLLVLEQMVMFDRTERIRVMVNLMEKSCKNWIVFAHHSEYLEFLKSEIQKLLPDRNCMLIRGNVKEKKRKEIMKTMEEHNNCILFASYACVGTGLTFKNIDYGIFAESFKSEIINKQSLGRGLLLAPGKEKFKVYDIIDCLPTNRILFQGKKKKSMFEKEGFKVTVSKVQAGTISTCDGNSRCLLLLSKVVKS